MCQAKLSKVSIIFDDKIIEMKRQYYPHFYNLSGYRYIDYNKMADWFLVKLYVEDKYITFIPKTTYQEDDLPYHPLTGTYIHYLTILRII